MLKRIFIKMNKLKDIVNSKEWKEISAMYEDVYMRSSYLYFKMLGILK